MADEPKFKVGDRVRIFTHTLTGEPMDGTIRVLNQEPGKLIGVEFDNSVAWGLSLDGLLDEEKNDPASGVRYGKGMWTHPNHIEKLEA